MIRRKLKSVANGEPKVGESNLPVGKDVKGRFVKGNGFGRGGNPFRREQARVRNMLNSLLKPDELRAYCIDWIKHARAGKGTYHLSLMENFRGRLPNTDFEAEARINAMEDEIQRLLEEQGALTVPQLVMAKNPDEDEG